MENRVAPNPAQFGGLLIVEDEALVTTGDTLNSVFPAVLGKILAKPYAMQSAGARATRTGDVIIWTFLSVLSPKRMRY
jgi:hypothetical protein